ncbi:unnamed protein product [Bursaphelenchus okinawaensis]|uniref:Aminopeptidase n=1 Tax=Bursaphelenchus okinawaensis TaxID=465554 RepID=A0A811L500_9BILA|nr:unnamed protein product [Bursaphelenchus okinawaensis]CAG9119766.1 unnamed protein product [Bursaphelenchus okinawaensis]
MEPTNDRDEENRPTSLALQLALRDFWDKSRGLIRSRPNSTHLDLRESCSSPTSSGSSLTGDINFQAGDESTELRDYRNALAIQLGCTLARKKKDPSLQNGTRGMSARVEAGGESSPAKKISKPKDKVELSKSQLLAGLILTVAAVIVAILITYTVTKESLSRTSSYNRTSASKNSHYSDEFDIAHFKPHEVPDLPPEEASADAGPEPTAEELRLVHDLVPVWYNLSVKVYVPGFVPITPEKNLTFDGAMIIKFKVTNPTNRIELNAHFLNFLTKTDLYQLQVDPKRVRRAASNSTGNALIVSSNGTRQVPEGEVTSEELSSESETPAAQNRVDSGIKVTAIRVNETLQKVVFDLDAQLQQDQEYYFLLPYSGPIDSKLSGLYLTQYSDANGRQRYAAVTQMEPTDARRFAPCFDEPAFKAVWRLRVIHPVGSRAVSNALEIKEDEPTNDPDWLLTTFEETLPMSSYLLALVVSDFEYVEGHTKNNVRFRIWARKDALIDTQYALQAGIKCLEFYEDYFGIPFPLAKQDMMAFPDFAAGAMENWGLVTYREKYLLHNPSLYSALQKVHVATVVAHELAHQWFGNLVTMKWWSDLWLNEGFATLMEYIGTDAISDNKLRMDEYFVYDALSGAFDRDSRATSHPLYFDISKAEDVSEAFDAITYDKGGSVLRMLRNVMGEKYFKKGVTIYLNRFKFKNAEHKDLWQALSEAVPESLTDWSGDKFDVDEFAKLWTRQMGYPVIEVKRVDENKVELTQKRFKMDETALEKPRFRNAKYWYKWDIPLWYTINGTEKEMLWLHENQVLEVPEDTPLIVNYDSKGFYRVQYSKHTLDSINRQLQNDHTRISVKSRARIIDDTFTLAEAGRVPYQAALNLTIYLQKETEYLPWAMAMTGLESIEYYVGDEPEADYVRSYIKGLIKDLYENISFENLNTTYLDDDKFFETLFDTSIISRMCRNRDQNCVKKLMDLYFNDFVYPCQNADTQSSKCSRVPVPLRGLVYCEGVRSGSETDWDKMLALYKRESVQVERDRLMIALTCSRDTHSLKKLLRMTTDFNNTLIRLQDKSTVFDGIASTSPLGQQIAMEYFMDHWTAIYRDFKDQPSLLKSMVEAALGGTSNRVIEQVTKFIAQNEKTTRNVDAFKQRLEILETNKKWMDKNFQPLSVWFRDQNKKRAVSA